MKRLQVQTLCQGGLPAREVAVRAEVSESTVRRIAAEDPVTDVARAAAAARRRLGRPQKVAAFEDQVRQWLEEEPRLSTVAVLARLREVGCPAGKSAVYAAVRRLRRPPAEPVVVRFEGLPGEFSQHDFGQVEVQYETGGRERRHFFASRLKYSRRVHVVLTDDERTETVCRGLVAAFTAFGGVPLEAVFDNPRTIVVHRDGKHILWQETFAQFCAEGGIVPRLTWPGCPEQKGAVENLVGFVKRSFFRAHRFRDRADLEAQLARWQVHVNDERVCRATREVPKTRWLAELPRLRPLRFGPEGFTLKASRVVRTDGFAEWQGMRYFAGAESVGQTVTLHVAADTVAVYAAHRCLAVHPRRPVNGRSSVLPEQRGALLQKPGARSYAQRQLLADLNPAAQWFLTELRHRRPLRWQAEIDALYALLETHGEAALQQAFAEAGRRGVVGADVLAAILDGGLQAEDGR